MVGVLVSVGMVVSVGVGSLVGVASGNSVLVGAIISVGLAASVWAIAFSISSADGWAEHANKSITHITINDCLIDYLLFVF
jgi:hypothetical protein